MCGRYQLKGNADALQSYFGGFMMAQHQPRYNIAPTQSAPIVRSEQGRRVIKDLRFGLIPAWVQQTPDQPLVNARSESVFEKPSFRGSMQLHRCLVPATGFYEWQKGQKPKQPFLIKRSDQPLFAFAGIWASWQAQAQRIESFAIITRPAGQTLESIHHRVPVTIEPEFYDTWLSPNTSRFTIEACLLAPDDDEWHYSAVSQRVNQVRHDDPQCEGPRAMQQSLL